MNNATKADNWDTWAARLLMLSFFMPLNVQGGLFMVAGLYFPVKTLVTHQAISFRQVITALLLSSAFFIYVVALWFTPARFHAVVANIIANRASLFLMPVILALTAHRYKQVMIGQIAFFTYVLVGVCIVVDAWFLVGLLLHPHTAALSHVDYRIFFERASGVHPTYVSLFLCFGIAALLVPTRSGCKLAAPYRNTLIVLMILLLLPLLAKTVLLALVVILVLHALLHRHAVGQQKYWIAVGIALVAIAGATIPFVRQRLTELWSGGTEQADALNNSVEARKMIWNIDTGLLHHCWLTGVGPGKMQHDINFRHFFSDLLYGLPFQVYDPHSEYMQQWLSFGIAGIVLFVAILSAHLYTAIRSKNLLYVYLMLMLCLLFFTESVLARQYGILFYTFFTGLFMLTKPVSSTGE